MPDQIVVQADGQSVSEKAIQEIRIKALQLSEQDENFIEQVADLEVFNVEIQEFLENANLEDVSNFSDSSIMSFTVSEAPDMEVMSLFGRRFRRLKEKLRRIVCEVVNSFGTDGLPSWDEIIRTVLIAVAASFFAGPMGALLLPIIIAIVARLIKLGVAAVCPVG